MKNLLKIIKNIFYRNKSECYNSLVSIPIRNYVEVMDGNLDALVAFGNPTEKTKLLAYEKIVDERINKFGLSNKHEERLRIMHANCNLVIDYIENEKNTIDHRFKINNKLIENLTEDKSVSTIVKEGKLLAFITSAKGIVLHPTNDTAYDLLNILQSIKLENKDNGRNKRK